MNNVTKRDLYSTAVLNKTGEYVAVKHCAETPGTFAIYTSKPAPNSSAKFLGLVNESELSGFVL